jgi:DNA-directed RNA polymerase subunit E'/Rpb7
MIINPYFTTKLSTTIILHPHQMNNNMYLHLKKNLEQKTINKCFNKYGFITKIIEILKYDDPIIEAENVDCSALFSLEFVCNICLPMKNMVIICQIQKFNKLLMVASNGPISVVITNNRINGNVFFKDNNNNIRYKSKTNEKESKLLGPKEFIKVTIQTVKFFDGDKNITTIGYLNDVATDEEIEGYYTNMYKETNIISHEKFVDLYTSDVTETTDNNSEEEK